MTTTDTLLTSLIVEVPLVTTFFYFLTRLKLKKMSDQLEALKAEVTAVETVEDSAIALIGGLKTALDAAIAKQPEDDGAALTELSNSLEAKKQELAASITANTPAATAS